MKVNLNLLNKSDQYLIAVSGGVDSVACLSYLTRAGYSLTGVHINHNTRGDEHLNDITLVKELCDNVGVSLVIHELDIDKNTNFHLAARNKRFEVYQSLCCEHDLAGVILAHHLDDVVENILMRERQVTSRLIKPQVQFDDLVVIRPLLDTFKEEIISYANDNDIKYIEDSSNASDKYKRNYYRHHVASKLNNQEKLRLVQEEEKRVCHLDSYDTDDFLNNSLEQQKYFLIKLLNDASIYDVSSNFLDMVVRSYTKNGSKSFFVNDNYILWLEYGEFRVKKSDKFNNEKHKQVKKGYNSFNGFKFYCPYDECFVRCRKVSDKVYYPNFSKKVSRIMIDDKIPYELRDIWPVLTDANDDVLMVIKKENICQVKNI